MSKTDIDINDINNYHLINRFIRHIETFDLLTFSE